MSDDDPLRTAAMLGAADEVGRLLAAGARPDPPAGGTPLYQAAVRGDTAVVRMLLAAGADPGRESTADGEGLPLCAAACWGHLGAVVALLDAGADPDLPEDPGGSAMTALHWACANDRLAVVAALLAQGADPGLRDRSGGTALTRAAERGAAAVAAALLGHGAAPDPRALDLARRYAGHDIEAEVRTRAGEHAPRDARIGVRREEAEGGGVRVVAEVRDAAGRLRSETSLGTGHAEIVRLLERHGGGKPSVG
ncbi:hypothetical protein FAF44_41575 [Nonomuraea sp. MG754425]|uniref:ankyrin repeat domain-containing protein n=1 Tax=Nonomuraea sp. MG754425 TaxID=2570319 RepID=UPI001F28C874|nr:ankyrin repeat domain-containing protein [Nonomuraea sp. MG754425]MCF6474824.1 hypothetical protein [Nonomuraea sp. MG754425]